MPTFRMRSSTPALAETGASVSIPLTGPELPRARPDGNEAPNQGPPTQDRSGSLTVQGKVASAFPFA